LAAIKELRPQIPKTQKGGGGEFFFHSNRIVGGGFQFLTKPAYQTSISFFSGNQSSKRGSQRAIGGPLSIIAYKATITKGENRAIRRGK